MTQGQVKEITLKETTGTSRILPLSPEKVSPYVHAEYEKARITWGIPNNLIRTVAWCPQLALTEVGYANSFVFDEDSYATCPRPGAPSSSVLFPQVGFLDRVTKELVISMVSLVNKSRYSITHHGMISWGVLSSAVAGQSPAQKAKRAEAMILALVDDEGKPSFENAKFEDKPLFTLFQTLCLKLALKMNANAHSITDEEFAALKGEAFIYAQERVRSNHILMSQLDGRTDNDYFQAYANAVIVELTWCIGHFAGLLNKWFIVLKIADESDESVYGFNFFDEYNKTIPNSIKARNNALLGKTGWGD
jgi:hypothetical protein